MTHELLQTDIELAIRLTADQRSDEEIIRALVQRGVDPGQAAQLLEDLRSGADITARSRLPEELTLRRRSRSATKTPAATERPVAPPPPAKPRREPRAAHAHSGRTSSRRLGRGLLVIVTLALVVTAFVLYQRSQHRAFPMPEPAAPAADASAGQDASPSPLLLEMQPDGLRLAGNLVSRDTLLPALHKLFGAPTRTNQVAQTGALVYAYDQHGLLIYAPPGGGTNSLVLDCDATGGVNGTTSPFAGSLRLGDHVIRPDTDARALAAITELGLKPSGGSDSVWHGRCHGLDVLFAYLRSPQRLSLIEIDFK